MNDEIIKELAKENVEIKPYNDIYKFVKGIDKSEKILIDSTKVNYSIYNNIPSEVEKDEREWLKEYTREV